MDGVTLFSSKPRNKKRKLGAAAAVTHLTALENGDEQRLATAQAELEPETHGGAGEERACFKRLSHCNVRTVKRSINWCRIEIETSTLQRQRQHHSAASRCSLHSAECRHLAACTPPSARPPHDDPSNGETPTLLYCPCLAPCRQRRWRAGRTARLFRSRCCQRLSSAGPL